MLTTNALTGLKNYIKRTVSYARYKVGSTYYQTSIEDIYIDDSSGKVIIEFTIDHTLSGTITVTEVQLWDTSGELWLSKSEAITRKDSQSGIFYRFTIDITEV
ncbi:MAG: hypothetical protein LUG99_00510 [Lachnospiraceae bacterium]|nr:hypothetical protein [Lachnospiraceae bacterium]